MTYQLFVTSLAERDISEAADYIAFVLKNPQASDRLLDEVELQLGNLAQFPASHPLANDPLLAAWGIRFVQVKNYLAFYVISEERQLVTVIRFLYARSNWANILKYTLPSQ